MRILTLFLTLLAGPALLAVPNLEGGGSVPVGMILQTKGEVFVERDAVRNAARLADLLQAGDQLIITSGEVTFLFCPSQEKVTLKNGTTVQLSSDSLQLVAGEAPGRESVGGCALPRVALGSASLERVGGLRARGHPPIVLYVGGTILRPRPLFQWEPVAESDSYQLALKNEMGATVWEHRTTSVSAVYPESMAPLEENKDYQWEVRAERGGETMAEQRANFVVKPNPGLAGRAGEDPIDQLLRATALESAGYFAEAADFFRELRKAHPEDIRFTRHLAWLYWNAGLISAANEEREKLSSTQE